MDHSFSILFFYFVFKYDFIWKPDPSFSRILPGKYTSSSTHNVLFMRVLCTARWVRIIKNTFEFFWKNGRNLFLVSTFTHFKRLIMFQLVTDISTGIKHQPKKIDESSSSFLHYLFSIPTHRVLVLGMIIKKF